MGHQESLMFCDTKQDLIRLCKLLNTAAADPSERGLEYACLDIFEIARLKKDVTTWIPSWTAPGPVEDAIYPKGCYFVWWGGDRAPQRDDEFLLSHDHGVREVCWDTVFAEYLSSPPATELLKDIEEGHPMELQENEWIRTFHPNEDNYIPLELIEQL